MEEEPPVPKEYVGFDLEHVYLIKIDKRSITEEQAGYMAHQLREFGVKVVVVPLYGIEGLQVVDTTNKEN